jgi:hypothetical protein
LRKKNESEKEREKERQSHTHTHRPPETLDGQDPYRFFVVEFLSAAIEFRRQNIV